MGISITVLIQRLRSVGDQRFSTSGIHDKDTIKKENKPSLLSFPETAIKRPLSFDNCCLLSCNNFFTLPSLILSKAKHPRISAKAIINQSFAIMANDLVEVPGVEPGSKTKANNLITAGQIYD